jgi:hypothetical protein
VLLIVLDSGKNMANNTEVEIDFGCLAVILFFLAIIFCPTSCRSDKQHEETIEELKAVRKELDEIKKKVDNQN